MPTIDVNYAELQHMLNLKLDDNLEKLDDILAYIKAEVKVFNPKENSLSIEMKDTARADLWSVEGLTRALQSYTGQQKGLKLYTADKSDIKFTVDANLFDIRPHIACAVIKNVHLSDDIIKGIMHLQDKLDHTYGRSRRRASIGIYNLDLIKPPIKYTAVKPETVKFVPLGFTEKMTLDEILEKHPKGQEYGHIVKAHSLYPMLYDSQDQVLSFPPIINSNDLGKITEDSCNLLIEVTGTLHKTVLNTLTLITTALIDRGGKAYSVTIDYPQNVNNYTQKTIVTPDFSSKSLELSIAEANRLLGLNLSAETIVNLLGTAGLGIEKVSGQYITVLVPCYRVDVMHQVDIIEDIAIAYGYNNIEPLWRELPTTGKAKADQRYIDIARDLMIGLGYQEVLNTTLTNPQTLFQKMNQPPSSLIELTNPKVITMTCLRNQLLPGLVEFLSSNQSVEFPQKIFELGRVTLPNEAEQTQTCDKNYLSAVTAHPNANFSEIKSVLDSFMTNFGVEWQIQETTHPSFIDGRAGKILVANQEVGIIGEINPETLEVWKLENPVAGFELHFQTLIDVKQNKPHT